MEAPGEFRRSRILFVASHTDSIIEDLCNKVMWLHQGSLIAFGDVHSVLDSYAKHKPEEVRERLEAERAFAEAAAAK